MDFCLWTRGRFATTGIVAPAHWWLCRSLPFICCSLRTGAVCGNGPTRKTWKYCNNGRLMLMSLQCSKRACFATRHLRCWSTQLFASPMLSRCASTRRLACRTIVPFHCCYPGGEVDSNIRRLLAEPRISSLGLEERVGSRLSPTRAPKYWTLL